MTVAETTAGKTTRSPIDPARLAPVLRRHEDAELLPAEAYTDPAVLAWELEHLYETSWACTVREEDLAEPGLFLTVTVGREAALLVRGDDGVVCGFFNVCQHRGSRLVEEPSGRAELLICPYHSWTYGLDGRLIAAEHMAGTPGFDRSACGLSPVATETFEGLVFVNVSGRTSPLAEHLADLPGRVARFGLGRLRRGAHIEYDIGANWKSLSENYQECYHCPSIHPELVQVTPYRSAWEHESHGPWLGGPMRLAAGCTTMSFSGRSPRPPLPGLSDEDLELVHYYTVLPNLWVSMHPDYVMTHTVWPLQPDRTRVVCEWLFDPEVMAAPGFDPSDAVEFWDRVNRQDWAACERVQRGIGSKGFRGGHYSSMERTIHTLSALFARSYLEGRLVRADEVWPVPAGSVT